MMKSQGRDMLTGTFQRRPSFETRIAASIAGPRSTAQDIVWAVLRRAAPVASSILEQMLQQKGRPNANG